MKKWYAVLLDPSQFGVLLEKLVEEWEHDAGAIERFEAAAKAGELNGREIIGMWIIDDTTEQDDVIEAWGRVSDEITTRYNAYKKRQQ